jgi:hypothetical protein
MRHVTEGPQTNLTSEVFHDIPNENHLAPVSKRVRHGSMMFLDPDAKSKPLPRINVNSQFGYFPCH